MLRVLRQSARQLPAVPPTRHRIATHARARRAPATPNYRCVHTILLRTCTRGVRAQYHTPSHLAGQIPNNQQNMWRGVRAGTRYARNPAAARAPRAYLITSRESRRGGAPRGHCGCGAAPWERPRFPIVLLEKPGEGRLQGTTTHVKGPLSCRYRYRYVRAKIQSTEMEAGHTACTGAVASVCVAWL